MEPKRRRPNKTDREVYMKYGKTGAYSVAELMPDNTLDYNNLEEARTEHVELDEAAATDLYSILTNQPMKRTADTADTLQQKRLMALYRGNGVLSDEQRGELQMEESSDAEEYVVLGDDMLSDEESSDSVALLSTMTLPSIDWTKHRPHDLANYNRIALFGANEIDDEIDMELAAHMGRVRSVDEWHALLQGQLCSRFRIEEPAGHGSMHYFELKRCFVALYLLPSESGSQLVNYLFLAPAKRGDEAEEDNTKQ